MLSIIIRILEFGDDKPLEFISTIPFSIPSTIRLSGQVRSVVR
jgi:hypothetical protein